MEEGREYGAMNYTKVGRKIRSDNRPRRILSGEVSLNGPVDDSFREIVPPSMPFSRESKAAITKGGQLRQMSDGIYMKFKTAVLSLKDREE